MIWLYLLMDVVIFPPNFVRKDKCWVHTDQAPNQKGRHCIQGFVSLTANESTSFVVYDGSHLLHEKYFADKNETHGKRWNLIDQKFVDSGTRKVLKVNPGDLVLWDARTLLWKCCRRKTCSIRMLLTKK